MCEARSPFLPVETDSVVIPFSSHQLTETEHGLSTWIIFSAAVASELTCVQ